MKIDNKVNVKIGCQEEAGKKCLPVNVPRAWSQLAYAGEYRVPQGLDPSAGSWPMYFFQRQNGQFIGPEGRPVCFAIQDPTDFNFQEELLVVIETLNNLTPEQKEIAKYWGDGPATKQWTPIIDRLIDTYKFSPVRAARVLAAVQAGINDAFVITWYFKYLWDIARPNQLDQNLVTLLCTPMFPTYPSGHSVISGTAEAMLSYFFEPEAPRLKQLAEENAVSRVYGGVHFQADVNEGLRLGRQIGNIITGVLAKQDDQNQSMIDIPVTVNKYAELPPPPYQQVIPYPPRYDQCNLPLLPE